MHTHWRTGLGWYFLLFILEQGSFNEWKNQGLPMSTSSDEACKLYDAAVSQYVGWYDDESLGGMCGTLEKMKTADPGFVMGQVVTYGLELLGTSRTTSLDLALEADLKKMVCLSKSNSMVTPREKKHVTALELWANGSTEQACYIWEDILVEYPHDVLALKFAHDTYFYLGNSYQIRDSIARVLPYWKPVIPLYGYILGMHSFGLEETNLYPEAETVARKALSINSKDAWATHTLCHVMEMMGRQYEGIYMMEKTNDYWTGDYESALTLFDTEIFRRADNSGAMLDLVDACSLLYRLEMEGVDIGKRWNNVYLTCKGHLNDHVLAFNDLHILMACLGDNQKQAVTELMNSIEEYIRERQGTNREVTAEVGYTLFQAFTAYNSGEFSAAVEYLNPIRYKVIKIGGSHAQRDLVSLFLIQTAIKSHKKEHHKLARALLNERKLWKPNAPMTDRLIAKAIEAHCD